MDKRYVHYEAINNEPDDPEREIEMYYASYVEAAERAYQRRIAQLEKALREIAALDYKNAATNGAAYEAVQIASGALLESKSCASTGR